MAHGDDSVHAKNANHILQQSQTYEAVYQAVHAEICMRDILLCQTLSIVKTGCFSLKF